MEFFHRSLRIPLAEHSLAESKILVLFFGQHQRLGPRQTMRDRIATDDLPTGLGLGSRAL
jgi:hypothetical protein